MEEPLSDGAPCLACLFITDHPTTQPSKGKLFEDLDALAGTIAFAHSERDGKVPLLVTASVDRIRLQNNPQLDEDMGQSVIRSIGRPCFICRTTCPLSNHPPPAITTR